MKSIFNPPKPSQDKSRIWVWLDYLVKWATSERVDIVGWECKQTASGKYYFPPPTVQASGVATTGNWNYRGTWSASPPSKYMTFDVVLLGSGTSAGMYLSTIDANTNSPDSGTGWVQVSSSSGTWL